MKCLEDFGYMSIIETVADVDNTFLSRREITCNFAGLAGKLKRTEAADMIAREFKLDGKAIIIPMRLKTHVGRPVVTGTFYVYEDEGLAKKHVNPTIFSRLEKSKAKDAKPESTEDKSGSAEGVTEKKGGGEEEKEKEGEKEDKKEEKSE